VTVTRDPATLAAMLMSASRGQSALAIDAFPALSEEDAYEVQRALVTALCSDGSRRVAGFKISMTSPETQALARASGPAYGTLTSDMVLQHPATLSLGQCLEPMLELEIQFIVDEDLAIGGQRPEIVAKCSVAPGLEVPDARFSGWFGNLTVGHIVSDNALAGHVIVGHPQRLETVKELRAIEGELAFEGEVIAAGRASSVMGDPVVAVEWLAERLGAEGRSLRRGMVVSSGTLCMPVPARPGRYLGRYEQLGQIDLSFGP
jgi:2-keto-4-pentenoate hydratase